MPCDNAAIPSALPIDQDNLEIRTLQLVLNAFNPLLQKFIRDGPIYTLIVGW